MFNGKKKVPLANTTGASVLHNSLSFKGNLNINGPLHLDCTFTGNITCKRDTARLVVGPNGNITGDISVANIEVHGTVRGNIICNNVKIYSKATINGNISYKNIEIEPTAKIEGEISSNQTSPPVFTAASAESPTVAKKPSA